MDKYSITMESVYNVISKKNLSLPLAEATLDTSRNSTHEQCNPIRD